VSVTVRPQRNAGGWARGSLENGYEVTVADVRGALQWEGIAESSLKPGDAIFFRYGLAKFWNDRTGASGGPRPGIGADVARWVVDHKASMVGSDQSALEVAKAPAIQCIRS
jgi:kynurenine formamidase